MFSQQQVVTNTKRKRKKEYYRVEVSRLVHACLSGVVTLGKDEDGDPPACAFNCASKSDKVLLMSCECLCLWMLCKKQLIP